MRKKKPKYTKGPIGEIKIVEDFLLKPKDLVLKEKTVKLYELIKTEIIEKIKMY